MIPLKRPTRKSGWSWMRIDLVRDYHRRAGIHLPNEKLHATLHAIVEAQIALKSRWERKRRRVVSRSA